MIVLSHYQQPSSVTLGGTEWIPEVLPGSFDRSLASIAEFEEDGLDTFMRTLGATKSWTTGTYTVDCAKATTFPNLKVFTDFDDLSFTPNDYIDLVGSGTGRESDWNRTRNWVFSFGGIGLGIGLDPRDCIF